jgi:PPOX class probable F420-dependent enzyme
MTQFAEPRIQGFLGTKTIVVLATVLPDGGPLAMAMWFLHDAKTLTMISEAGTQKVRNLRRDPRVAVVAEAADPIRGVAVQGRVEFLPDGAERRALVEGFHAKYAGLRQLWRGREMPVDRVMFRIVPERVRAWGLE